MHRSAVALHAVCREIHGDVVEADLAALGQRVGASQQGAHPGEQAVDAERLGHEVVGARVQPANRVLILRPCRDHDDRKVARRRTAPDLAADLDPGHHRKHPVQQDEIGTCFGDARQRLLPVRRLLDAISLSLEIVAQHGRQRRLVLDHEDERPCGIAYHFKHSGPFRIRDHSFGRTTANAEPSPFGRASGRDSPFTA